MGNTITRFQLKNLNDKNVPNYSFKGTAFQAKIVKVYDGDTCTAVVKIHGKFQKVRVRCLGYDSPEINPRSDMPEREEHMRKAVIARDALAAMVLHKIVRLEVDDFDKYGRFLGTLYVTRFGCCGEINMSEYMLKNGYGYEYFGGKKREDFSGICA